MPILDTFSLAGKRALVTGGNRGLGLAFVRGLAEAGADVAFVARDAGRGTRDAGRGTRDAGRGTRDVTLPRSAQWPRPA
jgi:NAD(P)-dependent dehydrogenase (short-subunit alcohol dehydrogenase family)